MPFLCRYIGTISKYSDGAVVVAQLVERSLPIPEVRGSNLVKKKPCMAHFFKKAIQYAQQIDVKI